MSIPGRDSNPMAEVPILVVEDDGMMSKLIRDMLMVMKFKDITITHNGREALSALAKREFELVICDWKMQHMDGIEFTKAVRNKMQPPTRFVPIIMLTGKGEKHDVEVARDAGITEYLVKPFNAEGLYNRIKMVVEKPRQFVAAKDFKGPDRRRHQSDIDTSSDRRKRPHEYDN